MKTRYVTSIDGKPISIIIPEKRSEYLKLDVLSLDMGMQYNGWNSDVSEKGGPGSGGARPGAGRKPGSGAGGGLGVTEPTQADRDSVNRQWDESYLSGIDPEDPQGIGIEEAKAIRLYAASRYTDLNKNLRNGTLSDDDKSMQRVMDYGIAKLGYEEDQFGVFRGVSAPAGEDALSWAKSKFNEGGDFSDKGFMSSTTNRSIAHDFAGRSDGILLNIEGKSAKSIRGYTSRLYENEVLYPRGTTFRVNSVEERFHPNGSREIWVSLTEKDNVDKGYRDFADALNRSEQPFHDLLNEYGTHKPGKQPDIIYQ